MITLLFGILLVFLLVVALVPRLRMKVLHEVGLIEPPEWAINLAMVIALGATPWFFYRPLQIIAIMLLLMVIILL